MLRVVLNPTARGGAGRRLRPEIERELARRGVRFEVVETAGPGHALELAQQACADGVATVVAAGGDGTVHEVGNGILRAADAGIDGDVALGIIPIGTGNDFVKVIPGTSSRRAAYQTLAAGRRYAFDVAAVSWPGGSEYCLNAAGTGVDVEVVRQIRAHPRRSGALVYIEGLVRALRRYRPVRVRVTVDGVVLEAPVMMIAVANGICVGGFFRICPGARPADGALDLFLVRQLGLARVPSLAARILRGRRLQQPEVTCRPASHVRIEVVDGSSLYFQLDGELREPQGAREMEITVQPGRLAVVAAHAPAAAAVPLPQSESIRGT